MINRIHEKQQTMYHKNNLQRKTIEIYYGTETMQRKKREIEENV